MRRLVGNILWRLRSTFTHYIGKITIQAVYIFLYDPTEC